jgi:small-conductance mechanosensitive channel
MFDQLNEIDKLLKEATFFTRMAILFISMAMGIVLSHLVFAQLRKITARLTDGSYPLVQRALKGMPTAWGLLAGGYAAMEFLTFRPRGELFLDTVFHSIAIVSLTVLVSRLISGFLAQKVKKTDGTFAATSIIVTIIELIVYILGLLFLLQSFGISITPLLTALGVGGLAMALALQDTLSNLFSGINILLSKQIKMGDFIKLSTGEEGTIVDMNWRNTTIKLPSDSMVVVPNQKIATSVITNYSQPFAECSIVIPVTVSYASDLEQVEKITSAVAKEILLETPGAVSEFDPFIRYGNFAESGINFNVILRVKTVTDQHLIRHEFIKRLYIRYQKEGIKIPFPIRTVRLEPSNQL